MNEPYLRIYAAGGTGSNIVSKFQKDNPEISGIAYSYFDTSRANLSDAVSDDQRYLLERDGSGSLQKENYGEIGDRVLDALQEHPPAGMNAVVFSAAGG